MAASSSTDPQVFISFRGTDVRLDFISYLATSLRTANITVFTDRDENLGAKLENLLVRIEESQIAVAIFSENYTNSTMCLDELVKIKECMAERGLIAIPIFYKVDPSTVKHLSGHFGDTFRALKRNHLHEPARTKKWEDALTYIPKIIGKHLRGNSDTDAETFIKGIVEGIQKTLSNISMKENRSKELKLQEEIKGKQDEVALMITARELEITDSEIPHKWNWSSLYEEQNSAGIEIATMLQVQMLKIVGKFKTSGLRPGKEYEVVFMVKVEGTASGWESPVNLKLKLEPQGGSDRPGVKAVNLTKHRNHGWVNIRAGVFVAPPNNAEAKGRVTMYQYVEDDQKKGLVIKGVAIRPTS